MLHLVTCRCVLPQFKRASSPPQHQFVVFSVIDDDGSARVKFAQCNSCGIVHKVTDICKSEVVPRESMGSLVTIDDIKASMSQQLTGILEAAGVDLPTWEYAQFICENKLWGLFVVLTTDIADNTRQGKYVRILGENLFKVEVFTRDEVVK
jgi:hypothetical protein